jgi:hypothetical protein
MFVCSGRALALALASCVAGGPAFAQDPMTFDFSWSGVAACSGGSRSPAFVVRNAPPDTRKLMFTLFLSKAEYGGEQTPYPPGGRVPAGAIYTNGPCQAGDYRWNVVALDQLGRPLATADRTRPFP